MASKGSAHEQRHLRPVYDALDARNYKQALKSLNSIQQKGTDTPVAKSLRALCLERTNEKDQAYRLCLEVMKTEPVDDAVLIPLNMTLKRLDKVEDSIRLYESASKKEPAKESLATAHFNSLIRLYDWQKQQLLALRLFKQFNKPQMYWWYVAASVMQGTYTKQRTPIELSRKMIEKMITEGKQISLEELLFYIEILKKLNQYETIVEVLEGPLGNLVKVPSDKLGYFVLVHKVLKNRSQVIRLARELLQEHDADSWDYHTTHVDQVFEMQTEENFEQELQQAIEILSVLKVKELEQQYPKRGPFLAFFYLRGKLVDNGLVEKYGNKVPELLQLIKEFYKQFATKRSFIQDMQPYLKYISDHFSLLDLLVELSQELVFDPNADVKTRLTYVQRKAAIEVLEWASGQYKDMKSLEQVLMKANQLMDLYKISVQVDADMNLEARERGSGDDFAILVGHLLIKAHNLTGQNLYIFEAITVLVNALVNSKYNYDLKIMAIRLYSYFDAIDSGLKFFESLDIKHIQLDSMSYLVLEDARSCARFEYLDELCGNIISYHEEYYRENPDYVMSCYNHGTYAKIEEFMDLRDKLIRSYTYGLAKVQSAQLQLLNKMNSPQHCALFLQDAYNYAQYVVDSGVEFVFNDDTLVLKPWGLDTLFSKTFPGDQSHRLLQLQRDAITIMMCCITLDANPSERLQLYMPKWKDISEAHLRYSEQGSKASKSRWCQKFWELVEISFLFLSKFKADESPAYEELAPLLESAATKLKDAKELTPILDKWSSIGEISGFVLEQLPIFVLTFTAWLKVLPKKKAKKQAEDIKPEIRAAIKGVITAFLKILTDLREALEKPHRGPVVNPAEDSYTFQMVILREAELSRVVSVVFQGIEKSQKSSRTEVCQHLKVAIEAIKALRF